MDLVREVRWATAAWWPQTTLELRTVHGRSGLRETRHLECKRELPRGDSIAKSAGGLANHGGVVIYGAAEEPPKSGRFELTPFPLAGEKERVAQVVSSSVHGHLVVDLLELPCEDDPDRGFLVMVVPASPRSPHMVEAKGDCRYYGRHDTVTEPLHGDEVDMLMDRRRAAERDRDHWLAVASNRNVSGVDDRGVEQLNAVGGVLTVVIAPVLPPPIGLRRTPNDPLPEKLLTEKLTVALDRWPFSHHGQRVDQRMRRLLPRGWRPVGGSYVAAHPDPRQEPEGYGVEMEVDAQMAVRLRAAGTVRLSDEVRSRQDTAGNAEQPLRAFLDEHLVARYLIRTLAFAAGLLTEARYLGAVDVGIALTHTRGTLSWVTAPRGHLRANVPGWAGYVDEEYRRTDQVSSTRLVDHPQEVARNLLQDLLDALAQGDYPSGEHPIGVRP